MDVIYILLYMALGACVSCGIVLGEYGFQKRMLDEAFPDICVGAFGSLASYTFSTSVWAGSTNEQRILGFWSHSHENGKSNERANGQPLLINGTLRRGSLRCHRADTDVSEPPSHRLVCSAERRDGCSVHHTILKAGLESIGSLSASNRRPRPCKVGPPQEAGRA
jgi:hypothetical protein